MTPDDDPVDYTALARLWPVMAYGDPSLANWFRFVGRSLRERNGLAPRTVSRGPRGLARTSRGVVRRSKIAGEFEVRR